LPVGILPVGIARARPFLLRTVYSVQYIVAEMSFVRHRMDFDLTKEQRDLIGLTREVSKSFAGRSLAYDKASAFPEENFKELKAAGLHKLTVPKRYGGLGLWGEEGYLSYYLVL